jgi:hypothetical protein
LTLLVTGALAACGSTKSAAGSRAGATTTIARAPGRASGSTFAQSGGTPAASTIPGTPGAAVTAYYAALSLHQFTVSDGYLAPSTRAAQDTNVDSPNNNLVSLSGFTVKGSQMLAASALPGLPAGVSPADYSTFALVTVEYDAMFRRVITADNGPQIQFLYLGRLTSNNQWQILSIGSGP